MSLNFQVQTSYILNRNQQFFDQNLDWNDVHQYFKVNKNNILSQDCMINLLAVENTEGLDSNDSNKASVESRFC